MLTTCGKRNLDLPLSLMKWPWSLATGKGTKIRLANTTAVIRAELSSSHSFSVESIRSFGKFG